ncbi:MAG: hypothetical protein ABI981_03650 [Betaproteobacteria bacterium]
MAHTDKPLAGMHQPSTARTAAHLSSDGDARVGLAKLEPSALDRTQARWALARGAPRSSVSQWAPGLVFALILVGGQWLAGAFVDRDNRVALYLAYAVSALTALVFLLGWQLRILSHRVDAVAEIIEQQK